ncbi:MAG: ABC transporter substrate-binding protein [Rubrivivax sp.]|nr:ABC transporter substrate-binding protein [Rubrivivax sp.]MCL4696898.1 ABC transporter substrate-binding protein [Burkholderiaceae bacterium]
MTSRFTRRMLIGLGAAALFGSATAQQPAAPGGPIRLVVGFPAGGAGDLIARVVAEKIAGPLGTTVVVENKPGAGGRIAAELLKNSPPDGTTVMIAPLAPIVLAPLVFRKLAYNPETDFVPVAQLVKFPLALAVGAASPHKTLGELSAAFKANPGKAAFGTSAAGSQLHFLGVMYGQAIKVELTHVPYQGGAPLVTDLIGAQVPAGIDIFPFDLHKSGKIRLLAMSGAARSPLMPDVPTFKEQGVAVEGEAWFGAFAAAKTPAPVVQRIAEALVQAVRQPDVRERFAAAGLEATGLDAAAFGAQLAADRARWKPVVAASGFRGD